MKILLAFFRSSLGKKYVMAITGCLLFLFVVAHMLGNLQIFLGSEQINAYGHFLQSTPELIWPARIGLIVLVLLHVVAAIQLSAENKAARPKAYGQYKVVAASYASRTMLMSGIIIAVFIVYHLLHFTVQYGSINFTGTDFHTLHDLKGRHDVYKMMVKGFQNIWVSFFYILGMGLLMLHLSHGVSSMFQSVGLKNKKYGTTLDRFAIGIAILLFLGYCSIPIAILTGIVK